MAAERAHGRGAEGEGRGGGRRGPGRGPASFRRLPGARGGFRTEREEGVCVVGEVCVALVFRRVKFPRLRENGRYGFPFLTEQERGF